MGRTRVTTGTASAAAQRLVPDPMAVAAPPHETDPWDAAEGAVANDPVERLIEAGALQRSAPVTGVVPRAPNGEPAWGAIIESVLAVDPQHDYLRLYGEIRIEENVTEFGVVFAAMNRAEQNAVDALRLARYAKNVDESTKRKADERLEVLRTAAKDELSKEVEATKDEKGKATLRAPTIKDIEDRMQANWPDEYNALHKRKDEHHAFYRVCEQLADSWRSRCATLRVMLERVAPARGMGRG